MTEPSTERRRELRLEQFIAASPQTVWEFWVDPKRMCEWWGSGAELEPEPGGVYRVRMGEDGPIMSGRYVALQPHDRLVFTFGWEGGAHGVPPGSSEVEVTLTAEGGGTRLVLRHTQLPSDTEGDHRSGWAHFLPRLAEVARHQTT